MLLVIVPNEPNPYEGRALIKVKSVARTEVQGAGADARLVAIDNHGDRCADFKMADVRNYHLEED